MAARIKTSTTLPHLPTAAKRVLDLKKTGTYGSETAAISDFKKLANNVSSISENQVSSNASFVEINVNLRGRFIYI